MNKADIGLIGLAVMGENLVMNINSRGYSVVVYNRSAERVKNFIEGRASGKDIYGAYSLEEFVDTLKKPRKVMMMVKAGQPVDELIEQLIPLLDPKDILIDGGNSHFPDTIRRTKYVESKNLLYIGTGVSGGEEGALKGPSIMPGGSYDAWKDVKEVFQSIAAKVEDGTPCCDWVGNDGAGHFVKMVHNGIEYGDMQLICESYHIMREILKMSTEEMHKTFIEWNERELKSYLIEITRDILGFKDENGEYPIDYILDAAGQKGTGKWTSVAALDEGIPLTLISEAVFARCLSAIKDERVAASKILNGPKEELSLSEVEKKEFLDNLFNALYASKIVSYAQGFSLLRAAADTYEWDLNFGNIALLWRGGCIIRSDFLKDIKVAFEKNPNLSNLLTDDFFRNALKDAQLGWRKTCATAITFGVPIPAMSAALSYYDGYRTEKLPANLLQAQRDYFGAHTYERIDRERNEFFHTNWTGDGGDTVSSAYIV